MMQHAHFLSNFFLPLKEVTQVTCLVGPRERDLRHPSSGVQEMNRWCVFLFLLKAQDATENAPWLGGRSRG